MNLFKNVLSVVKMCFVASTLVLCQVEGAARLEPIGGLESLAAAHADLKVWARDEFTGEEGWKRPIAWFTTHPEELFTLGVDTDADGAADEELTGTGEHPFWVEDYRSFVPMRDLRPGMRLALAQKGKVAIVTGNVSKRGPPRGAFTTYNFEVEDFHTYFVGEAGVWVHNSGKGHCEKIYSLYLRFRENAHQGETPFQTLQRVRDRLTNKLAAKGTAPKEVPAKIWGRSSADACQEMLNNYTGPGDLARFPTVKAWREEFFSDLKAGVYKPVAHGGVDIHHSVEAYIQRQLGIPDGLNDLCPGIPMPRNKSILDDLNQNFDPANQLRQIHKGKDNGGISGILQSRIPAGNPNPNKQAIIDELFDIHNVDFPQYNNIWPVARDWLRDLQQHGFLDQTLNIP